MKTEKDWDALVVQSVAEGIAYVRGEKIAARVMNKRTTLLAKLEQKVGSHQLKTGIFEHDGISIGQIPEFHPDQLESVPELLALARTQASLTLAEVAERLGVTRAAVHHRERSGANVEVATLLEQAQVMGYEVRNCPQITSRFEK